MTESNLITISDVQAFREISPNIKIERFDAFQMEVIKTNLKQVLGEALYFDFFDDFSEESPQTQKYIDLLDGKDYEYSGETIQYHGLKPFIIFHWLALFAREGDLFQASYGNVNFTNNPQQPFQLSKDKDKIVYNFLSKATEFQNEIIKFLNENSSEYSLWNGDDEKSSEQHNLIVI